MYKERKKHHSGRGGSKKMKAQRFKLGPRTERSQREELENYFEIRFLIFNIEAFYLKIYSLDAERYFKKRLGWEKLTDHSGLFFHTFNLEHICFHISFRHLCRILD